MNSQLRFVMHPDDEREFAAQVLADPAVLLIDGPRWKAAEPQTFRTLDAIRGSYCILWSPDDQAALDARYIAGCNDWYCESEYATVQFLRSEVFTGGVLTEGRIAVSTANASAQAAQGVERRYKALGRFVRKHYTNAVGCAAALRQAVPQCGGGGTAGRQLARHGLAAPLRPAPLIRAACALARVSPAHRAHRPAQSCSPRRSALPARCSAAPHWWAWAWCASLPSRAARSPGPGRSGR